MPLVGNLRDFALHDFLYLVDRGYKTGSLLLRRPNDEAALFFEHGKLIAVIRSHQHERLGAMLVRMGKITLEQSALALWAQQSGDPQPLGQLLVEQDVISETEIQACIQRQIEETVYELFAWPEGEFKFEAGVKPALDQVQALIPMPVEHLIMEGVRRIDEMTRLRERIPSNEMLVVFTDGLNQQANKINMTADQWNVFAHISGTHSISEIIRETGLRPFDVSQIVFGFLTSGLVEVRQPAARGQAVTGTDLLASARGGLDGPSRPLMQPNEKSLVARLIDRIRGS
ncbi:MAG: DUF4388 domain-containing protein [Herpetosiphonaceae bacterium]|nr:DUF4388 domain-containing protein [Herpetosiphonaceae bacterium]